MIVLRHQKISNYRNNKNLPISGFEIIILYQYAENIYKDVFLADIHNYKDVGGVTLFN